MSKYTMSKYISYFAAIGYSARALVYLTVGALALMTFLPFVGEGESTDSRGAIAHLKALPFGGLLLVVLALGLLGFSIWRAYQAIFDVDKHGSKSKGLLIRGILFLSAIVHLFLAFFALNLSLAIKQPSGSSTQENVQWVLSLPFGSSLATLVGLSIIAFGLVQIYKAYSEKFLNHLNVSKGNSPWILWISKLGLSARGAAFAIVGWFILQAGWNQDSSQAGGFSKIWDWLSRQPMGNYLALLVAVGLIAFAFHSAVEAKYRKT